MRRNGLCLLVVLFLGPIGSARADVPEIDLWAASRLALEAHVGLGAPLGFAGLAVEVTPVPWLSLSGGVGAGLWGRQLAAMARFRHSFGRTALGLGAGVSHGPYGWKESWIPVGGTAVKKKDNAVWANGDISFEIQFSSGFQLKPYVGVGRVLNPGGYVCTEGSEKEVDHCLSSHSRDGPRETLPYVGFAVGYAWPIDWAAAAER